MSDLSNTDSNELDSLKQQLSELRERELQLRTTYNNLKQLFELAPFGYQSLDEDGHLLDVNQTWLNTLGRVREDVIGRNFTEFLDPDCQPFFSEDFPQFKKRGVVQSAEIEMLRKDGSRVAVSFDGKVGRDSSGNFLQTHCFFRDITERKKSEVYGELGREILQILSGLGTLPESIHRILEVLT
jgi:PAS domain S-box-containing protein